MKRTTSRRIWRNILTLYRMGYTLGRCGAGGRYVVSVLSSRGNVASVHLTETDTLSVMHIADEFFEANRKAIEEIAEALADQYFAGAELAFV